MSTRTTRKALGEEPLEGFAEVEVENGVDDGIERRVDVAEPRDELEKARRLEEQVKRLEKVENEERHPADGECAHYDAHCSCCSALACQRDLLSLFQRHA